MSQNPITVATGGRYAFDRAGLTALVAGLPGLRSTIRRKAKEKQMRGENQRRGRQPMVILGLVLLGLLAACGGRLKRATVPMMDEAEAVWQADPIHSYRIVVDVERPEDRRRYVVSVEQDEIIEGVVIYWDYDARDWDEPYELAEEQSFPFTVPGLFEMVRGALEGGNRTGVRVAMQGEPPFPHKIELGPVRMDGQLLEDTAGEVIVREFEPAVAEER